MSTRETIKAWKFPVYVRPTLNELRALLISKCRPLPPSTFEQTPQILPNEIKTISISTHHVSRTLVKVKRRRRSPSVSLCQVEFKNELSGAQKVVKMETESKSTKSDCVAVRRIGQRRSLRIEKKEPELPWGLQFVERSRAKQKQKKLEDDKFDFFDSECCRCVYKYYGNSWRLDGVNKTRDEEKKVKVPWCVRRFWMRQELKRRKIIQNHSC